MIYRAEQEVLLIFNENKGLYGALSGTELGILKDYLVNNKKDPFVVRLRKMGLIAKYITKKQKAELIETIARTKTIKCPQNSLVAPESLHIDITLKCHYLCAQCYKKDHEDVDLEYGKFTHIIDQAKRMGVFQIALGGGEPTLVKDLPKYIDYVRKSEMACTITTSGYGLNEELIHRLKEADINNIQISLNGSTAEINNFSRCCFEETIQALELVAKNKLRYGINWVARKDNIGDLKNVIFLAVVLKADNINILRYKPSNEEDYQKIQLDSNDYLYLISIIKNVKRINIKLDSAFSNLMCKINKNGLIPMNCGCSAGRRFMVVDVYGRFKPCSHLNMVTNTTAEGMNLSAYWNNSDDLNCLRTIEAMIKGQCKTCLYLSVCRGCRAICQSLYDDIYAGEKKCPAYKERKRI